MNGGASKLDYTVVLGIVGTFLLLALAVIVKC